MTNDTFKTQMLRLQSQYGDAAYSSERKRLIYQEFHSMGDAAFARLIDRLIGECDRAPLLPKFREFSANIREQEWHEQKKQHGNDAKRWSRLPGDEIKWIMEIIKKRVMGGVSDADYQTFKKGLDELKDI